MVGLRELSGLDPDDSQKYVTSGADHCSCVQIHIRLIRVGFTHLEK